MLMSCVCHNHYDAPSVQVPVRGVHMLCFVLLYGVLIVIYTLIVIIILYGVEL